MVASTPDRSGRLRSISTTSGASSSTSATAGDAVGGLADDLEIVRARERRADAVEEEGMVVDQDHAGHRGSSRGSRARTVVPRRTAGELQGAADLLGALPHRREAQARAAVPLRGDRTRRRSTSRNSSPTRCPARRVTARAARHDVPRWPAPPRRCGSTPHRPPPAAEPSSTRTSAVTTSDGVLIRSASALRPAARPRSSRAGGRRSSRDAAQVLDGRRDPATRRRRAVGGRWGRSPAPGRTPPGAADRRGRRRPRHGGPGATATLLLAGRHDGGPALLQSLSAAGGRRSSERPGRRPSPAAPGPAASSAGLARPGSDPQHGDDLAAVAEVECLARAVRRPRTRRPAPGRRATVPASTSERLADRTRSDDTTAVADVCRAPRRGRVPPAARTTSRASTSVGLGPVAVVEAVDAAVRRTPSGWTRTPVTAADRVAPTAVPERQRAPRSTRRGSGRRRPGRRPG